MVQHVAPTWQGKGDQWSKLHPKCRRMATRAIAPVKCMSDVTAYLQRTDFHRAQDRIGLMVYRVCQSRTLVSMNRSSGAARVQDLTGDLRSLPLIDLPWADSLSVDPQANSR